MSDYTEEQFEQMPDFMKENMEKVGDVYRDKGFIKVKSTADDLRSKLEQQSTQTTELSNRLSEFEQNEQTKIEQARKDALEKAKTNGDAKAVEERYQQQLADLEKRLTSEIDKERGQREQATSKLKGREQELIANKLASELATDVGSDLFAETVQKLIDVDLETGKPIFLNGDGSASSLDLNGFKEELLKDKRLKPLLKAPPAAQGGGNANGSNGGGSANMSKGKLDGSKAEKAAYFREKFKLDN